MIPRFNKELRKTGIFSCLLAFLIIFSSPGQTILTTDGLAAFGTNAPSGGGGGGGFPSGSLFDLQLNNSLADSSGNSVAFTITAGTATYDTGQDGIASHAFLGAPARYFTATDKTVANFTTSDFTVSTWIKCKDTDFSGNPIPWSKGQFNSVGYFGQCFNIDGSHAFFRVVTMTAGGNKIVKTKTSAPLSLNTWYNIVFVKSGTTGTIYINGTDQTDPTSDTLANILSDTSDGFRLAAYFDGSIPFVGAIDETAVWASALTSTQVGNINSLGAQ